MVVVRNNTTVLDDLAAVFETHPTIQWYCCRVAELEILPSKTFSIPFNQTK